MNDLVNQILFHGVENCYFHGSLFDDDKGDELLLKIDQGRYMVSEGYKITLTAVTDTSGTRYQHFYSCDLQKLIEEKHFIFFVKNNAFNK